jgi:hypothetical protein
MPLKMGRDFSIRDDGIAPPVVIVNEDFVRHFMPAGSSPLGQLVSASDSRFWKNMLIVGVVGNSQPYSLREPVRPCVYVPFFQQPPEQLGFGTFEIKATGSLTAAAADVQRTLSRKFPGTPLQVRPFTCPSRSIHPARDPDGAVGRILRDSGTGPCRGRSVRACSPTR